MANSSSADSPTANEMVETAALERGLERLRGAVASGQPDAECLMTLYTEDDNARSLLDRIFVASPFLSALMLRDTTTAYRCLTGDPKCVFDELTARLRKEATDAQDIAAIKRCLRLAKAKSALTIALADMSGTWGLGQVTGHLTEFADVACVQAIDWLLRDAERQGKFEVKNETNAGENSGYVAMAMGKHGAHELNYSSDIDLIVLYDPQSAPLPTGVEPSTFFVRLTKRFVELLQDMTEDGYVFRVDLRLRPDPRATKVAIAFEAACVYYENMGQNWERAAMIKARPVAGDLALGQELCDRLIPYIWRKYLDFAAIADVQSLKRQIHSVKGHGSIAVPGHNIKLGRGGIREIEFFVQTQQLIAGGRNAKLRGQQTMPMLDRLAEEAWITVEAASELQRAYRFLRKIEHRIQMQNDEQSHILPQSDEELDRFAKFCGFAGRDDFSDEMNTVLETVQGHYNALFEDADVLAADSGSLVFTGGEDDPETVDTLAQMGFGQPGEVSATIRGWHFGRYAATRSSVARERLTEIMPTLLAALANTGDPDVAFIAFDRFMARLPAGVQLFSMLRANKYLLDLIALILGAAPRLAEQLSQRPKVLDAVLEPGFFKQAHDIGKITDAARSAIPSSASFEERLDLARVAAKELGFQVGVRILSETLSANQAGQAYSSIADAMANHMLAAAAENIAERHGTIPGGRVAIVAMGKLGGQEMTATSDIDLILIYDHPAKNLSSDGIKPLSTQHYYSRLTQRLIAAISSQTSEGLLYEVDMRLRPTGSKGPIATSIDSFRDYHRDSAWTWEKLALTRARVVAGDNSLCDEINTAICTALCTERQPQSSINDIVDMRKRIFDEHGSDDPWNLKHARGGLVDCEFIAQGLQILTAHDVPDVLHQNTATALQGLGQHEILQVADCQVLVQANALYHRLMQVLRLCVGDTFDQAAAPSGLSRLVANAAECPDLATTHILLSETQERVAALFDRLLAARQ